MPFFSKLFEILPDAEELLSLEPEQLAGPFLVSLEGNQDIIPGNIIGYDSMSSVIQSNSNLKYPHGCQEKVLFALMEVWQWLEREGFVAPRPRNLQGVRDIGSTTRYFVTRRGEKIQTSADIETYHKTNLLPKRQLHPIIAQKVWSLFLQGDYDTAVFRAFKAVEIVVRKAGNYNDTDIGVALMRKALNIDDGNLTASNQQTAEKQARSDLFAGAIGSYKNPGSHRDVEITAEEAAEVIIFASHLLRIVDSYNSSETS